MTLTRRPRPIRLLDLAGLALLTAGLWAATIPTGNTPLNDDWVYALAVKALLETGRFTLPSPALANAFAHVYWGALFCLPFGFSFTALRVSTAILGVAGVLATWLLLTEAGASRRAALAAALCLAASPLYLELMASFMTDVPFTALSTASLWLYVRGVVRQRPGAILAAFALAFLCLTTRQFALVLLAGFGTAHLMRHGFGPRALATAALPVLAGIAFQLFYSHWIVATGRTPVPQFEVAALLSASLPAFAQRLAHLAMTITTEFGLFILPFLVLVASGRARRMLLGNRPTLRLAALATLAAAALVGVGLVVDHDMHLMTGNILIPSGVGALNLTDIITQQRNLPVISAPVDLVWAALNILGALAAGLGAVAIARLAIKVLRSLVVPARRPHEWLPALMLAIILPYLALTMLLSLRANFYDRYLLPLIPPMAVLLLAAFQAAAPARLTRSATIACFALLAGSAAFAVTATHDFLAWNHARWQVTDSLLQAGISPRRIDGGREFDGWQSFQPDPNPVPNPDPREYAIAAGPAEGYSEVARFIVRRWLPLGPRFIFVLHRAP